MEAETENKGLSAICRIAADNGYESISELERRGESTVAKRLISAKIKSLPYHNKLEFISENDLFDDFIDMFASYLDQPTSNNAEDKAKKMALMLEKMSFEYFADQVDEELEVLASIKRSSSKLGWHEAVNILF